MTNASGTSSQPAGWYYAQGDPPGTQRYWDGSQWQGEPKVTQDSIQQAGAVAGLRVATPGQRFIAYLIDGLVIIPFYIVIFALAAVLGAVSETLGGIGLLVGFLSMFGFIIYNMIYLQGTTGQTIGKKQQGIKLLNTATHQPLGMGGVFVRLLLSGLISMLCYLDHIWILVDEDNRRLSDKQLGHHVYQA